MYCLIDSFAKVIDITRNDLMTLIGHKGKEVVWPSMEPPRCFRGFHIQEIIDTLYPIGFAVVMFQLEPEQYVVEYLPTYKLEPKKLDEVIAIGDGVLTGSMDNGIGHAVPVIDGQIHGKLDRPDTFWHVLSYQPENKTN